MATTLTISGSGRGYACALRLADGTLYSDDGDHPHLTQHVAQLFERAELSPRSLEELRVDLGPGSYTGLRVAVTFARTLQALAGLAVLTATSLELHALRAYLARGVERGRTVRVILDARRQRFHHAAVRVEERLGLVELPAAVPCEQLMASIGEREVLLIEEAVRPRIATVAADKGCTVLAIDAAGKPSMAELLLHPLLAPRVTSAAGLEPLYLMGSYAE